MTLQTTLLDALTKFEESEVVAMLASGMLRLTGNFRGREREVLIDYVEAA